MFAQKDALFAIDEFIYSPAQKHGSFRFLSSLRTGQRQGQNQEFTFVTHNDHWELNNVQRSTMRSKDSRV